jgi:hypothetical protein
MDTEGVEERLQQILNDPAGMAQILSMAQSFDMGQDSGPSEPSSQGFSMDEGMLWQMMELFRQMQYTDRKQEALVCALKAYLAPERQEKLDRAMQLAKLSRLAGVAFGKGGIFGGKVG